MGATLKKAEPKTPHFLSLKQDIVAWSQKEKCGLKYVIHTYEKGKMPKKAPTNPTR
jgi:hypothetical protein